MLSKLETDVALKHKNWRKDKGYIVSAHPEIYFKIYTDEDGLSHTLDAYFYHKDKHNIVYVLHIINILVDTKDEEYEGKMYNGALRAFYNYTTTNLEGLLKEVNEKTKRKLKGLAYSLLCYLLNYCVRNNYLKIKDNLYKMYLSFGFKLIDPNYIERYEKSLREIKTLKDKNLLEKTLTDDELNNEIGRLNHIHNIALFNIPMEAKIEDLLNICKIKPKQIINCININKPETCKIEIEA
jgi:hypothetical protein